jgi:hypothetical protein
VTKPGKPGLVGGGEQIEFVARTDPNSLERALGAVNLKFLSVSSRLRHRNLKSKPALDAQRC